MRGHPGDGDPVADEKILAPVERGVPLQEKPEVGALDVLFPRLHPQRHMESEPLARIEAASQALHLPGLEERFLPLGCAAFRRLLEPLEGLPGLRQAPPCKLQAADQPPSIRPVGAFDIGKEILFIQGLPIRSAGYGHGEISRKDGEEILIDHRTNHGLDLDLFVGIGDDHRQAGLCAAADREIAAEPVDELRLLNGEGEVLFESAVIPVGRVSPAVCPVDFENGLTHQEAAGLFLSDGQAEKGIDPRCGLKDGFAQAPAPSCRSPFDGASDIAPEVIEVVLHCCFILAAVIPYVARESPGAEVLDEKKIHGPLEVDTIRKATALRLEVVSEPVKIPLGCVRTEFLIRRGERDHDFNLLPGHAGIEGVLNRFADHGIGKTSQDLRGEEFAFDGIHIDLAARHFAEFPDRSFHGNVSG